MKDRVVIPDCEAGFVSRRALSAWRAIQPCNRRGAGTV